MTSQRFWHIGINTVDIDGINLAAIKALEARTARQRARIEELEAEVARLKDHDEKQQAAISALEARLARLESLLGGEERRRDD